MISNPFTLFGAHADRLRLDFLVKQDAVGNDADIGRVAGSARVGDELSAVDALPRGRLDEGKVGVEGREAVFVVNQHPAAVGGPAASLVGIPGRPYHPALARKNRCADGGAEINAVMPLAVVAAGPGEISAAEALGDENRFRQRPAEDAGAGRGELGAIKRRRQAGFKGVDLLLQGVALALDLGEEFLVAPFLVFRLPEEGVSLAALLDLERFLIGEIAEQGREFEAL